MPDELIVLGSGGWIPTPTRATCCALLRRDDQVLIIDAGTGIARLIGSDYLDGARRIDILLTHFHLDHVAGLAYLPAIDFPVAPSLWSPEKFLHTPSPFGRKGILRSVFREPLHPVVFGRWGIQLRDIETDELDLGGLTLALRSQSRHSQPTLGLRFDDSLAWITDTAYDPASARFAAGVRWLCHEAWMSEAYPTSRETHSTGADAARVADEAGVGQLRLIHHNHLPSVAQAALAEATSARTEAEALVDSQRLWLD